jgi:hypothetical protein
MDNRRLTWPYKSAFYIAVAALALAFVTLTYVTRDSGHNNSESWLLRISITFPELIIWAVATISAVRFKQYAYSIKNGEDGRALNLIANSFLLLVLYVILLSSGNAVSRLFINSPSLKTAVTISNYLPLAVVLLSSVSIYMGSVRLNKIAQARPWQPKKLIVPIIALVLLLLIYAWQFYEAVPKMHVTDGLPRFTQSAGVLLITYVLPHILLWVLGLIACLNIARYALGAQGVIYRTLFRNLYRGLVLVYVCIFTAQLIIISPINLEKFSLWLAIAYLVLLLAIFGFGLIYKGAQQLEGIEKAVIKTKQQSTLKKAAARG